MPVNDSFWIPEETNASILYNIEMNWNVFQFFFKGLQGEE